MLISANNYIFYGNDEVNTDRALAVKKQSNPEPLFAIKGLII